MQVQGNLRASAVVARQLVSSCSRFQYLAQMATHGW